MRDVSFAESPSQLIQRFQSLWRVKLRLTVIVNLCFWTLYLFLSRHALVQIHTLPLTRLDRWAGFRPDWAWVYESIFVLTGVIPWMICKRTDMRRYIIGFTLLSAVSFAVFALFPVAAPRPANLEGNHFLSFITRIDGPLNAFPSLHGACLVYTLLLAHRLFGRKLHPIIWVVFLVWATLILYATLATKQHYAADLLAGGILGWSADWLAWRNSEAEDSTVASTARNTGATSQEVV